ncbi:MAG: DUF3575 domain-containing protein [Bacteroidales bacterium]|nr:DUF3575 domain-containing protein [Bacteroidales bacterium]
MKRQELILFLLIGFQFLFINLLAQNDSININSFYFDDGIVNDKNLIKFNALSAINCDFNITYERILGNVIGIEVGIGLLLPYHVFEFSGDITNEIVESENLKLGYSLWVNPRYYVTREAPELSYFGILYRKRNYGKSVIFTDVGVNFGYQFIVGTRMIIDSNIGIGLRKIQDASPEIIDDEWAGVIPFAIKIGYIL